MIFPSEVDALKENLTDLNPPQLVSIELLTMEITDLLRQPPAPGLDKP